jgi:GNAT superfamily N-acetyltransferase
MLTARLDSPAMPLPDSLRMRDATDGDLPAIGALRESVGWSAQDWALRAAMAPPAARCLVVVDAGDAIVGVGSGITYGALGFIGNMVVAEAHRHRGIGSAVLGAVIDFLEDAGCARLELFATPAGRPLYARHGFELTDPSAMVTVARHAAIDGDVEILVEEANDLDEVTTYDAPRFGGDRRPLLAMMHADDARPLLVARDAGPIRGYLWLRSDGPRVGPFLADEPAVAAALLRAAFERVPDAESLTLNLPMSNEPGVRWLRGLGVELEPWDGRMARGPQIARRDDTIYANLVGALG